MIPTTKPSYDSKNWTFFFFSKNLRIDPFLPIWLTPRIQAFWTFSYDLKELNTFLKMIQRIEPFLKMTRRLELSFYKCLIKLNLFEKRTRRLDFLKRSIKYRNFIFMTQRIEFFFFLKNMTHRTEPIFWHVTQGIEPFFPTWLIKIEPFFSTWLTELNPFFGIWLKELKFLHGFLTQRIELFLNMTRKIELFLWLKELSSFFQNDQDFVEYDSKNRTFFLNMSQRIEPFLKICSKNFFQYMIHRIELIFSALPTEWNIWEYDSKNWTFIAIKHDTKNWTSCEIKLTQRIEPSVLHDPKNWTFSNMT